jgi:hypothetical protein
VKRLVPSLVLMVIAGLAVAYLLLVERRRPSDAERALRAQSVLPVFRPDELTRVVLDRPGDQLVLARAAGSAAWSLTSPDVGPADAAAVETLLGVLAAASIVRPVSRETPAAALGEERARLELTFASGTVTKLSLRGPASTPAGAAYAMREDGSVVVAGAELATELLLPSDRLRDRVMAPYPLTRLAHFLEIAPGRRLELSRNGTDTFRLADGRRAARAATDAMAVGLADLRVERFLAPDDAAARALAASAVRTIELSPTSPAQGRAASTLRFGGACPGHDDETVAARDLPTPFVGCVATGALAALLPDEGALVERHLFQAKSDEVSSLLLRTPGAQLDLARKGAGWHERAPADRDLDPGESDAATALLEALVGAEGEPHALAIPPSPALAARDHLATLRAGEPAADEELAWAPAGAGAQTSELTLTPEIRALLEPTSRSVKPLALWTPPLDPARVAAVDVVTVGCPGHEQRIERRADGWSLVQPVRAAADQAGVIDLVDAVVHARARRWIDRATVPAGACPGVALSVGGQSLGCLAFGDGDAAEVLPAGGAPSFATLDPALAARACRWFVDRHSFALPPPHAKHADQPGFVTLIRSGRRLQISRTDSTPGPAEALATLDALVADDVIHLGPARPEDQLEPPALEVDTGAARLRFGAVIGGVRRATVSGIPAVFAIDAARLEPVFRAAPR